MSKEEYNWSYFEGGEYESYEELEDETKSWYLEVISFAGIRSGRGKALDVGCAYGHSLEILSDLGFEAFGLDLSEYAIEEAKRRTDARVSTGNVQDSIPFDEKFDLITCLDTLEHLGKPKQAIVNMYDKLEEGGLFVGSTPNRNWWRRKLGVHNEEGTHRSIKTATEWKEILDGFEWSELKVRPLQTVPLIWRVLDSPAKFQFPWGEIVHIKGVKR